MFSLFGKPEASRKFIDLIRENTSKWANWDPQKLIKVGDYGQVNRKTGELQVEGNIYSDTNIYLEEEAAILALVKQNPPVDGVRGTFFHAESLNAKHFTTEVNPQVSVAGVAEASIKGQWTFDSGRGAGLIISGHKSWYIPHGKLLEHLAKVQALKGMYLVTQLFICPTFAMFLSNEKVLESNNVSLALLGSAPIPHVSGATAGANASFEWWCSNMAGLFQSGHERDGKDSYVPLYTLQVIRKQERRKRGKLDPVPTGDDLWVDAETPWRLLDEDGNEANEEEEEEEEEEEDSNAE